METIKWETPAPSAKKGRQSKKTLALIEAGKSRPNEWFVLHEGAKGRPAPRPFNGPQWERAYRTFWVEGETVHRTYVRYIGNR